jgi:K+-transporting ATPase c subunit
MPEVESTRSALRSPPLLHRRHADGTTVKAIEPVKDAPLGGLWGVDMVNVLELNLELRRRYGEPGGGSTT